MLIKSITKKGDPIPMSAEECLPSAITYGLKGMNKSEWVLWALTKTLTKSKFTVSPKDAGNWEAAAEGQVMVGKTEVRTDKFHTTKLHNFKVRYKSEKDSLGLPDIKIVDFECVPAETNPSVMVGEAPTNESPAQVFSVQSGDLTPKSQIVKPRTTRVQQKS